MKYSFRNDYSEIGHPTILKTLLDNATVQNVGYGFDDTTKKLEELVCDIVGSKVHIVLASGGTQANLTVISKILAPYEAVISVDSGHINVHETGAVEGTGHKILTVPGENGKITSNAIKNIVAIHKDCHMVLPKLVYFSNSTEIGTTYSKEELEDIYNTCKSLGLYVFIDGARMSQALAASKLTFKDIMENSDVFYFGGTKNGLPYGEMIVINNEDIYKYFHYHLKNRGAMLAKTYVVSLMFLTLLKDDLYLKLAEHANKMSQKLKSDLSDIGVDICYPNLTNQLFIKLNKKKVDELANLYAFEIWEDLGEEQIIRLVTSWSTPASICDEFVNDIKKMR